MPETKNIVFNYKEVAEALIKKTDMHEDLWGLFVKFGLTGANISSGPNGRLTPAAIVPIIELGIQRFDKPNDLTIDASKVNPKPRKPTRKK